MLYKLMFFTDAFGDMPLAVLNGKYKIPDQHPFSPELIALLRKPTRSRDGWRVFV